MKFISSHVFQLTDSFSFQNILLGSIGQEIGVQILKQMPQCF